ncbi:MAG: hypothetical protein FD146_490 [Anaerolineaceae bacterium]|nr:MAG: hypothetical protein FD146_490 [Anaerolineaceae bacterium]
MKKSLKVLSLLAFIEGLLAILWIWVDRFLTGRGRLTPFLASGGCIILIAALGVFLVRLSRSPQWAERTASRLEAWLRHGERLFVVKDALVVGLIFSIEGFLLTHLWFPLATRPVTIWGIFFFAQAWFVLARIYRDAFRSRPGGQRLLRLKWGGLDPVQKKTLLVLLVIAAVYFGFFSWVNWHGISESAETFFGGAGDEVVIYPVVVEMVSSGPTFAANSYRFLIHEDYHYGYPYFYLNALVLFFSRLVFGSDFANHTQINLFILRQFVSVLPMMLAILVFVYIVTKFKSVLYSAGMFIVMLFIPGVIRYNQRFWHPDALMILFIALTFYCLQRDRLRFGRDFYYAAVMCALATAVKLYGFFFFLAIAGYLLAGLSGKVLTLKKMILAGLAFLLVMGMALIASSPFLLVPTANQSMIRILKEKSYEMSHGYDEPDPQHIYRTGLDIWLQFFDMHYTRPYFFFFLLGALALGSLLGSEKYLNRLILAWCLVVGGYLVFFVAAKSYQYPLPLMLPFYAGGFLFPAILNTNSSSLVRGFFNKPAVRLVVRGLGFVMISSQFLYNGWLILISPNVRVFF